MHWFEETHIFKEDGEFSNNIVFWKRQMDDIFFVWKGSKEQMELFVWKLNGIENRIQFTLQVEEGGFLPFLDVGITKLNGLKAHTLQTLYA